MIILLLVICIVLRILVGKYGNSDAEFFCEFAIVGCVLTGVFLAVAFPYNIEPKIALYSEENAKIDEKIKDTVRTYMDYEKETYTNLVQDADLTTLLIAYPQLNSNELVKTEIDTYIENNKQIKSLKEQQIDKNIKAWWLYFGGGTDDK